MASLLALFPGESQFWGDWGILDLQASIEFSVFLVDCVDELLEFFPVYDLLLEQESGERGNGEIQSFGSGPEAGHFEVPCRGPAALAILHF
ncbi:MAG: hypothetical protein O3A87_03975 [Verrucomicrobia bacterium]|nr:hypothetical protein [Verrucomicrobiota bacterium]